MDAERDHAIFLTLKSLILPLFLTIATSWHLQAQLRDPIPEPILPSGKTVGLEDVLQAPRSTRNDPQGARARLNYLSHAGDGSDRVFVNDMVGQLYVFDGSSVSPVLSTYLDLSVELADFHSTGWSDGFNTFAFHPAFAQNGKLYTVHSETAGAGRPTFPNPRRIGPAYQSVVLEWTAEDPRANTFSGTRRELMRIDQPRTNHPIGQLAFNPNASPGDSDYGILYLASADGGTIFANAPQNLQRLDSPLGTIMRIDPSGTNSLNGQYGIPDDNPFVSQEDPKTLKEIWAYGLRNHHRFSWDTGGEQSMFISDIGENNIEEINIGQAGANYGWPLREGTFVLDPSSRNRVQELPENDALSGFTYPVAQYDHDEGVAITGGYVYRASALPELFGHYLFGDIKSGRLFYVDADQIVAGQQSPIAELQLLYRGEQTTLHQLMNAPSRVDLRFGQDQSGDIYLLTKRDGMIRKLVPDKLRISRTGENQIELRWVQGAIESASQPSGPWTTLTIDSPSLIAPTQGLQFFRLRR